ncbi:hypothetical protein M514_11908 [Trichuris suis]|uniref:Uncharacterized protein n=1 Tax=Trichuris suis TaxID=68888 RepID=A0A085N4I2_9BILA|nr:hypothetical protein M514_11908 [Trichuris suis]
MLALRGMLDDRGGFERLGYDLLWLLSPWASSSFGACPRRCLWLLESAYGLFVSSDGRHMLFESVKCSRKVSSFPTVVMAKMSSTYRLKKMGASEVLMLILSTNTEREKAVKDQEMKINHPVTKHPSFMEGTAAYPMECICCAAAFPESMLVVRDVYDVSQSGVYDSLQNLEGVAC